MSSLSAPPPTTAYTAHTALTVRRYLSATMGVVLLGIVLIALGIYPQLGSLQTGWQTWQKQRASVSSLERKSNQLEEVQLSEAFAKVDQVNKVMPSGKQLLATLVALNQVVSQSKVHITGIELAPGSIASDSAETTAKTSAAAKAKAKGKSVRPRSDYDSIDIELSVEGTLPDINEFLTRMESIAPLMIVTDLSLNLGALEHADSTRIFQTKVGVSSYFFTKSITSTVESAIPQLGTGERSTLDLLASFVYPVQDNATQVQGGGLDDLFGVQLQQELVNQLEKEL